MKKPKRKLLPAVRPNVGLQAIYRQKLRALVDEMARSYEYWIAASYKANEPAISLAMDATPAAQLNIELNRLGRQWQKKFARLAPELARYFAQSAGRRSDEQLKRILRKAGLSVEFQMTAAMRDILRATLAENVGLIKSIPQQYHTAI